MRPRLRTMADLRVMTRLHEFSSRLPATEDFTALLEEILAATIEM
jgi:hypothetical protein